ncbi:hypothetical protein GGTG_10334 [Gaeumannomyces tritici R3-111a-1]|uniref:Uncharacterized protein n=1 Tax=Gaeumannomyces tritici (strain R3-111a-1) TaxID=644352 RepID=J3PA10_GAET3|nr:hypothetical protein GGTG_10334 [Gaeumannomyces tritici R3-111a-1]EJT73496.1 hypothetical protein GGTG_10334 [Gaeumannomyces tritici R3-111a-1]
MASSSSAQDMPLEIPEPKSHANMAWVGFSLAAVQVSLAATWPAERWAPKWTAIAARPGPINTKPSC